MGDPAGIGPEVALLAAARARREAEIVWIGDAGVLSETARKLGLAEPRRVIEVSSLARSERRPGHPTGAGAAAAYEAILRGVGLVREGAVAGIVTAPVSKKAIHDLGHDFPGHTETIAALVGGAEVRMMMWGPRLRVVLVTTHVPYASVPASLSVDRVVRTAEIAAGALRRRFGIRRPRLALAGLNPHAGEGGAFGDDEIRVLAPAVAKARDAGIRLSGPHPADTVFHLALEGEFDAVIALYHDQGLAPFKVLHFRDGVNVTLGLPFPRTSPDHGTAFAIAGKGRADAASMTAALRLAARMAAS
jgi:4-hydroxythreonine-4-phosphate dehydrogenase